MDKKQSRWDRLFKFAGEKGFYIVLFICVAVIGASAWVISGSMKGLDEARESNVSVRVTPPPAEESIVRPPQTAQPAPESAAPQPSAEPESGAMADEEPAGEAQSVMADSKSDAVPNAFVWPVAGEVETPHSVEALVYSRTLADWRTHRGLDIAATLGDRVMATASGTVERVYADDMLGTTVVLHHGGGLRSIYSNLAELPAVAAGDSVSAGDTIGSVGETALAEVGDITHLHFEMTLDGETVDPLNFLPLR